MTGDAHDPEHTEAFNRCRAYFQAMGITAPQPDWTYIPDWKWTR